MNVTILGFGAWGTTLGKVLAQNHHKIILWGRDQKRAEEIRCQHTNSAKLPDVILPTNLIATTNIRHALIKKYSKDAPNEDDSEITSEVIVVAIASQYVRLVLSELCAVFEQIYSSDRRKWPIFVSVTKGMEQSTKQMMSQVVQDVMSVENYQICCLAGPNLAREVAVNMPVAATFACQNLVTAERVAQLFDSLNFRTETTTEIHGVELLSCLKNIYSLTTGYYCGKGYGASTTATILTQAIREISELLHACGCDPSVLMTYAGVGDLIATGTSKLSRNFSFGKLLGKGSTLAKTKSLTCEVVEGVPTALAFESLINQYNLAMPVLRETIEIIRTYDFANNGNLT